MFSTQKTFNLTILSAVVVLASTYASAAGEFKTNTNGIAIGLSGSNALAWDDTAISIGKNSQAMPAKTGLQALFSGLPNAQGGIAIGTNSYANENGIHIGNSKDSLRISRAGATVVGSDALTEGLISTVVGTGTKIKVDTNVTRSGSSVQGAVSTVVGAYNTINATSSKDLDGVGLVVNGAANTVEASNGVIISGVGNKVTNSYKDETINASSIVKGNFTSALQDKTLGSVMVNGSGNTVDYANYSLVTGVGNTLKGKDGSLAKNNAINGYQNNVTDTSNGLVMGSDNNVTESNGTILLGNKATLNKVTDSVLLGHNITVKDEAEKVVALGDGTNVQVSTGVALGSSSTADRAALDATAVDTAETNVDVASNKVYAMDKADATYKTAVKNTVKGSLATVSVGSSTATRQITNLAAGSADTDAVNVAQLNSVASVVNTNSATINQYGNVINQNTTAINELRSNMNTVKKELRAGIAGAVATAGLPQAYAPGKNMVAAAVGGYRDQSALAVGASRITDNGKVVLKLTGNVNSRGDLGGSVGAGYQW